MTDEKLFPRRPARVKSALGLSAKRFLSMITAPAFICHLSSVICHADELQASPISRWAGSQAPLTSRVKRLSRTVTNT